MICKNCKQEKPKEEFYKYKRKYFSKKKNKLVHYTYRSSKCAKCVSSKDGLHKVYLIYNENYVGMTIDMKRRMYQHKKAGKDVSRVYVIFKTKSKKLAHFVETFLHLLGFKGLKSLKKRL